MPSLSPRTNPSKNPNGKPSLNPSLVPSLSPSSNLSVNPNGTAGINPFLVPSLSPSTNPSERPSCLLEYEYMRLQRIKRNQQARLAELELLVPLAPRTKTNRSKHVAMQDDVVRRVQPKRNVKTPYLVTRRILMTLSSARERIPSIRPTQERRTLSARECITSITRTRRITAQAALIIMTRTTRRS